MRSLLLIVALMMQNEDMRDAWVLRAGAELWKAVIAEADHPAEDTQKALAAVRYALDCARFLRCAEAITEPERSALAAEAAQAAEAHCRPQLCSSGAGDAA